jgi:hypothetical protein
MEAFDPVTLQLPVSLGTFANVASNELLWTALDQSLVGTITSISQSGVVMALVGPSSQQYNFYRGMLGTFSSGGLGHILTYTYLGSNMVNVTFDSSIPSSTTIGATFTATYNSTATSNCNNPIVFIPRTMDHLNLNSYLLFNEGLGESRSIVAYNTATSQATLNAPIPTWTNTHSYSVRRAIPFVTTITSSTTTSVTVANPIINIGDFVRDQTTNTVRKVVAVNAATLTLDDVVAVPWTVGGSVELLTFAYDNFSFITYSNLQREAATTQYFIRLVALNLQAYLAMQTGRQRRTSLISVSHAWILHDRT